MPLNPPRRDGLTPPNPGLKEPDMVKVHNRTNSTARVEIQVSAGDELEVSEPVAEQLIRSRAFAEGEGFELEEPEPDDDGHETDDTDEDVTCDVCGFVAKSARGLATHQRSRAHLQDGDRSRAGGA